MSSSSPSSSSSFSPPDHQYHQTLIQSLDQLCYVHCNFCDTILAVSVPSGSLFKTVTVRCGHCTNLLSVNMRDVVVDLHSPQPSTDHQHPFIHINPSSLLEEINNMNKMKMINHDNNNHKVIGSEQQKDHRIPTMMQIQQQKRVAHQTLSKHHHTNLLAVNRPPEKRQRVPSAYNRFIKEEIQRIKAGNPDIRHKEAFSAAAKNWAHFPHIHFGMMHEEQPAEKVTKKPNLVPCQSIQEVDEVLMHNGMFAEANFNGVSPY